MLGLNLSVLSVILGLLVLAFNFWGVVRPAAFGVAVRRFPRSIGWGMALMLLGTAWFIYNVSIERIADLENLKKYLYALFAVVGIGACFFVQDYLAARGAAVVMMLLAKTLVDAARWADTSWRLVVVVWAYVLVIAGIWFTISPHRMRDMIQWATANEQRTRLLSGLRAAFGLLLVILGLTVYR